jgi:hypothetical protein
MWKIYFILKPYDTIMKKSLLAIIAVIIVGAISAFALSPYFTESTIDEALPTGAIIQPKMEDKDVLIIDDVFEEPMMEEPLMGEETMLEEDDSVMEETVEESIEETMEETISISYAGEFIGVGDGIHDAQGDAYTIPLENGGNVLRLENFESTNGPDLFVYLATDDNASEFINLGELKASKGNQNYEIPENTDLGKYNKVLIWCKAFGVLFGSAELSR